VDSLAAGGGQHDIDDAPVARQGRPFSGAPSSGHAGLAHDQGRGEIDTAHAAERRLIAVHEKNLVKGEAVGRAQRRGKAGVEGGLDPKKAQDCGKRLIGYASI
jgi:hypothetical protein